MALNVFVYNPLKYMPKFMENIDPAVIRKVDDLREALHRHNYRYYVLDDPEIFS